jgi:hypothetical protein
MANARNILVGAADIYLTGIGVDGPTAAEALLGGYTTEGLELSYEPDYGEVQVDQLLDSARIFKQGLKVMLNTSFQEGTLEAMQVAFGQDDQVNVGGTGVNALTVNASGSNTTLNLAGGALGTNPVERALVAVGQAPAQLGTVNAASGFGGGTYNPTSSAKKERVYVARRVVSMETVSHGLKRNEATVFPVSFRCLPDSTNGAATASEYGKIIDRVYG